MKDDAPRVIKIPAKADTLLRFAEPEVVLAGHSLPPLSILEIFRYNKEYKLILGEKSFFENRAFLLSVC